VIYELFPNYVPVPFASKSGGHDPQLLWERRPCAHPPPWSNASPSDDDSRPTMTLLINRTSLGRCKQNQRRSRGLLCRWPSIAEREMHITAQAPVSTVSSGTLNSTIPYRIQAGQLRKLKALHEKTPCVRNPCSFHMANADAGGLRLK